MLCSAFTANFLQSNPQVCGHAFELIQIINSCIDTMHHKDSKRQMEGRNMVPLYVVYKLSDRFSSIFPTLFSILFKLPSIVSTSSVFLTNIWLSTASWDKYSGFALAPEPIFVYFPPYLKTELATLLEDQPHPPTLITSHASLTTHSTETPLLSSQFIKFFIDIFFPITHCFPELVKLYNLLFPIYEMLSADSKYRHSQPAEIIKAMQPYFKQINANLSQALCAHSPFDFFAEIDNPHFSNTLPSPALAPIKQFSPYQPLSTLPETIKYVLIASYLASHNPPKLDSRIFGDVNFAVTSGTRIVSDSRKKLVIAKKAAGSGPLVSSVSQYQDAKAFVYERMLAIYSNIVEPDVTSSSPNVCVQSQVRKYALFLFRLCF